MGVGCRKWNGSGVLGMIWKGLERGTGIDRYRQKMRGKKGKGLIMVDFNFYSNPDV